MEKGFEYCYKNRAETASKARTTSKERVHKTAETSGELIGNKVAEKKIETKVCT